MHQVDAVVPNTRPSCASTELKPKQVSSRRASSGPYAQGEVVVLVAARAITICVSGSSSCARATTELMVYAVSLLPAPAALPRSAPIRSSSAPPILPCVCLGDLLAPLAPNMLSKPAVLLVALLKSAWCRTDLDAPLAAVDSMWADWVARGVCRTRTLRNLRTARSKYAPCTVSHRRQTMLGGPLARHELKESLPAMTQEGQQPVALEVQEREAQTRKRMGS
eukprot:925245-Pelagomonas_calceolata.AAC.11